jgi:hypothetical protein
MLYNIWSRYGQPVPRQLDRNQQVINFDKSAVSFCRQVAARDLDMFCNFNLAKSHKFLNYLTTTITIEQKQQYRYIPVRPS